MAVLKHFPFTNCAHVFDQLGKGECRYTTCTVIFYDVTVLVEQHGAMSGEEVQPQGAVMARRALFWCETGSVRVEQTHKSQNHWIECF